MPRKTSKVDQLAIVRQQLGIGTRVAAPKSATGACVKPRPRLSPKTSGSQDPRYGLARWQKMRSKVLRDRPRCEGECEGAWPSRYTDHRIEVKDDTSDANFFNEANLVALCPRCHARKTRREDARRKGLPEPKMGPVNCGVDPATGRPLSPQHWWNKT